MTSGRVVRHQTHVGPSLSRAIKRCLRDSLIHSTNMLHHHHRHAHCSIFMGSLMNAPSKRGMRWVHRKRTTAVNNEGANECLCTRTAARTGLGFEGRMSLYRLPYCRTRHRWREGGRDQEPCTPETMPVPLTRDYAVLCLRMGIIKNKNKAHNLNDIFLLRRDERCMLTSVNRSFWKGQIVARSDYADQQKSVVPITSHLITWEACLPSNENVFVIGKAAVLFLDCFCIYSSLLYFNVTQNHWALLY